MCAMIAPYDYPVTFFFMLFSFPCSFSIELSIMRTLIFYLNFVFFFYFENIWMPFILIKLVEIYSVSNIFAEIDIILNL